ncbi:MAG: PQQ-binding-like beta-propeller repeat protein [Bacteroidetes bacterium]|nr:PQQ-binding-like beta-propeller repeat protein [Bacteroidota bacterium]
MHFFKSCLACLILLLFSCQNENNPTQQKSWPDYGGGPSNSKYFVQNQITKENVSQLEVAWTYEIGDEKAYQNNPVIVDNVMYVYAKNNSLVALDLTTGKEIWIHASLNGIARRGFTYWENSDRSDQRIIFTLNNTMQAIDAQTGKSILSFGKNGIVDLRQGLGRDPNKILRTASLTPGKIYKDIIVIGSSPGEAYISPPGHIRAYNVITGEMLWIFHTIPQPGEEGYDTWPTEAYKYAGGVNCWSEITIDEKTGIAYIPLGSPTYDYYGADRIGSNLFGNCLIALDVNTGKKIWHYQTVHHDLWDYDLASAPQLITVKKDGKSIDAVAIACKQGFLFVFNRATGEPVWPIEERPVPASNMPGEQAWPTQPFSTLPAFNRQTVTEDDISDIFFTEKELADWKARIKSAKKGLFTPPDTTEVVAMPGAVGGANWGNTAANPEKGYVYVLSQDYPSIYKLERRPPPLPISYRARVEQQQAIQRGRISFAERCQSCHGKDLSGTPLAPSLLAIGNKLEPNFLRQTILYGVGRMPPIQHIEEDEILNILAFLKDKSTGDSAPKKIEELKIDGPVVAAGGAPGEDETVSLAVYDQAGDMYPSNVEVPSQRYYTGYGLGFPYLLNPPWSYITAYDLNTGKIMWRNPLGEDPHALKLKGAKNTGVPEGSQRNGMIVTSNGIVFSTVTNGKIYAYDADNGNILWTGETPLGIATLPSMYEYDGRVYLVVNATTPKVPGWNISEEEKQAISSKAPQKGAYIVFSLPKK